MSRFLSFPTWLLLAVLLLSNLPAMAQGGLRQLKAQAQVIPSITNWCSDPGFASVGEIEPAAPALSCKPKASYYQKWFRFKATTSNIEVLLKSGGQNGSLRFPYMALFDEQMRELTCTKYQDETGSLPLSFLGLIPDRNYYLAVLIPNNEEYIGSFTLCTTDQISNDFPEGALELKNLFHWCSEPGAFTTDQATPDRHTSSCLPKGPNFNRWFTFNAVTDLIEIRVLVEKDRGTAQFPVVALFDANFKEIACGDFDVQNSETSLTSRGLIPGKQYYISVDHSYNAKYPGSFTLCVNATSQARTGREVHITGRVFDKGGAVMANNPVKLLSEDWQILASSESDAKGQFRFNNLDPDQNYLIKISDSRTTDLSASILLINDEYRILRKTVRIDGNLYGFEKLEPYYDNIGLIDRKRLDFRPPKGKSGIIGKVVMAENPVDGLSDLDVFLFADPTKKLDSTHTDPTGKFTFNNLPKDNDYLVKFGKTPKPVYAEMFMIDDAGEPIKGSTSRGMSKDGFFHFQKLPPMEVSLELMSEDDISDTKTDFSNIQTGKSVTLRNIHFRYGEHQLLERSFAELNRLTEVLKKQPELRIEVSGHSDNLGAEDANQKLSEMRAKTVVNYLVAHGISESRLEFAGYGGSRPVKPNDTDEGRQANRRVEFKVIP